MISSQQVLDYILDGYNEEKDIRRHLIPVTVVNPNNPSSIPESAMPLENWEMSYVPHSSLPNDSRMHHNLLRRIGRSISHWKHHYTFDVFNNALSRDHIWANGQPLLSDEHPIDDDPSNVYSNLGSEFSRESVLYARDDMAQIKSLLGTELSSRPDMLMISPDVDSPNAKQIAHELGLWLEINPWLKDNGSWFLIDKTLASKYLHIIESSISVCPLADPDNPAKWLITFKYGVGISDSCWVAGYTSG